MHERTYKSELRHMISLQGDAIRQVAALDLSAQIAALQSARRVLLVGTGTSHHAAQLGALMFQSAGLDAWAIASLYMAQSPPPLSEGDLVVVISHTGETAYTLATRRALLSGGRRLISVVGPKAGWDEGIATPVQEASETYTVSYIAALAVLARLAGAAGAPGIGDEQLLAVAARVDELIADLTVQNPLKAPARAMAIVGPGPYGITAREGALKVREASHVLSEGFDCEHLLHGYAVPYGAGDALLALQPAADPDGLTEGLMSAAASVDMAVSSFVEPKLPVSDLLAQIPMTVRLQMLAASFAEQRGTNPDSVLSGRWGDDVLWGAGVPL